MATVDSLQLHELTVTVHAMYYLNQGSVDIELHHNNEPKDGSGVQNVL